MSESAAFFSSVRASLFDGRLTQKQVNGLKQIIAGCAAHKVTDKGQAAYLLATALHETARTMQPIKEFGTAAYFRKMYDIRGARPDVARALGNIEQGDGAKFFGRGLVQITGRRNYADWSKRLGVDLVAEPDLALDPAFAVRILVEGATRGTFTGKKLADYIDGSKRNFAGARRIINGTDKAAVIAGYADRFLAPLNA